MHRIMGIALVAGQMLTAASAATFIALDIRGAAELRGDALGWQALALLAFGGFAALAFGSQLRLWFSTQHRRAALRAIQELTPLAVKGRELGGYISVFFAGQAETPHERQRTAERTARIADWQSDAINAIRKHCPEYEVEWQVADGVNERTEALLTAIKELRTRL